MRALVTFTGILDVRREEGVVGRYAHNLMDHIKKLNALYLGVGITTS